MNVHVCILLQHKSIVVWLTSEVNGNTNTSKATIESNKGKSKIPVLN
jgi:hypothetical protein